MATKKAPKRRKKIDAPSRGGDTAPKKREVADDLVDAVFLSTLFNLSVRNVRQLAQVGVLVRGKEKGRFKRQASLNAYLEHLRAQASGRKGDGKLVLADERARLAKEQADKVAIENSVSRKELFSEKEIAAGWSAIARAMKSAVLALPSKARAALPHLTAHDAIEIDRLCRELLEDLAKEVTSIEIVGADGEDEGVDSASEEA